LEELEGLHNLEGNEELADSPSDSVNWHPRSRFSPRYGAGLLSALLGTVLGCSATLDRCAA
jgi:hypothetical protein